MCGLNGIYTYRADADPPAERELLLTRDHMHARGPDGAGLWWSGDRRLGLGHRRLSIQDLSDRALQPMLGPGGRQCVVFNGEIYNYPQLRRELEAEGVAFRTTADTEVLLHLYRRDGDEMVRRLRGMFAFALWDEDRHRVLLARDPFGIKPLYLSDDGQRVRFASQVKALLAGGAIDTAPEEAGLVGFFVLGSVPEPYTLYRHIRAVPAGCTITVDARGVGAPRPYLDTRAMLAAAGDSAALLSAADIRQAVRESVQAHLLADVPVGLFLSAGIDSGVLAAVAAETSAKQLQAVTLGFDEYRGGSQDEVPLAQQMARQHGIAHHADWVRREDFEALRERFLGAMDQPTIDGLNTYLVSHAAAKRGMKVALSGVGGDELFAGYPSFTQVPRMARALRWMRHLQAGGRITRRALVPLAARVGLPKMAGVPEMGHSVPGAYLLRRGLYMPWELDALLDPRIVRAGLGQLQLLPALQATVRGLPSDHAQVAALELNWYMRNQLLRDADWAGMAHSLEIRVPLVDATLFEALAPALSGQRRLTKADLALVPRTPLPAAVTQRAKSGFTTPVARWTGDAGGARQRGLRGWAHQVAGPLPRPGFRVLALVSDAYGGHGGIAKFNRDLLGSIAAMPGCAEIVCLPRVITQPVADVPERIRFVQEAAGGKLGYALAIAQALRQGSFDLVLIGHINLTPLGTWLAGRLACRSMLFVHGIDAWQRHSRRSVVSALQRVTEVVGVSQTTLDRLQAWSGLTSNQLRVLPNCVDLQRFTPGPKPADLVQSLDLEGRTVLMTFGRLASEERYKGFDEVIELLPSLLNERPDIVYLVCGTGPDQARLQTKCHALGVDHAVRFSGYVPETRKVDYYRLADAYVMPSRGEGFGIVFLEAMACGIPALGSRLDGGREALLNGQLGELVDPAMTAEVHAGVLRTLARPKGRPEGLNLFSIEAFASRVRQLMQQALPAAHMA